MIDQLKKVLAKVKPYFLKVAKYKLALVVVFVAVIYGFVYFKINSLNNMQPTTTEVTGQSDPIKSAHISKSIVDQLQSLQDNSVNVQALFEQARNNPFQE